MILVFLLCWLSMFSYVQLGTGKDKTKYTDKAVAEGATVGGSSWTKEWLKFDNSYFKGLKQQDDEHLLVLETDGVLMTDPKFR